MPDYVDPYPANGGLPMADCWNTTTSSFMEDRTSLRIIVGKDNSNQVSNQRPRKWVGIYTITTRTVADKYIVGLRETQEAESWKKKMEIAKSLKGS